MRSALLRTQRPALILLTKAYRSTSTHALPVLAGVLPADLEVKRVGMIETYRANLAKKEIEYLKKECMAKVYDEWQNRWGLELRGRELYSFLPDVRDRMSWEHIEPDFITSQMLTGHGCFRKRLYDMKLTAKCACDCGHEEETRDHVLWNCPLYEDIRVIMLEGLVREGIGPVHHLELIWTKENFLNFRRFCKSWFERRSTVDD